jgi:hypothetical protein
MLLGVRALRKLILGFWSSGWGGGLSRKCRGGIQR